MEPLASAKGSSRPGAGTEYVYMIAPERTLWNCDPSPARIDRRAYQAAETHRCDHAAQWFRFHCSVRLGVTQWPKV